jgi:hypothetical protein
MRTLVLLFCLATLSLLTGCYPVKQYQSNMVGQFPSIASHPDSPPIPLAFVEFDDNGELFSRAQLTNTIQSLTTLRQACGDRFNAVVFIHGWKNNADNSSPNVAGFEDFLRLVRNDVMSGVKPEEMTPNCPSYLMGVYVGWRGARAKIAPDLTYWNATDAAVRAGGPALGEALFQIIRAVRPDENANSNLIVIGHSFGGRVLEKVMTPYLESLLLRDDHHPAGALCVSHNDDPHATIHGPLPTLTVLLNEAAPATDAKQFLDFLKCHDVQFQKEGRNFPLFLSITSDGDWANHVFLPLGQSLARIKMKTRTYCTGNQQTDRNSGCSGDPADPGVITNQSTYYTHTTASIPALYSHYVWKTTPSQAPCKDPKDTPIGPGQIIGKDTYSMCAISGAWNQTPYWDADLPVAIVPDHTDIFHEQLYDLLKMFIQERLQNKGMPPKMTAQ